MHITAFWHTCCTHLPHAPFPFPCPTIHATQGFVTLLANTNQTFEELTAENRTLFNIVGFHVSRGECIIGCTMGVWRTTHLWTLFDNIVGLLLS